MSTPSNLSEFGAEFWAWAMKCPIPAGYIVESPRGTGITEEATTAHGCPRVRLVDGLITPVTMVLHGDIVDAVVKALPQLGEFIAENTGDTRVTKS